MGRATRAAFDTVDGSVKSPESAGGGDGGGGCGLCTTSVLTIAVLKFRLL
jgi:hypothetical protein